ncbi:MAG: matrixin family metalloprotease [Planctomycetota bacterium]
MFSGVRLSGVSHVLFAVGLALAASATATSAIACGYCRGECCAAATDASEPTGFTLSGGRWPQPGGKGTPITVTYSYNNFLDGGIRDPDGVPVAAEYLRLVTEEAFGLWAAVAPIHFVEVTDVGTPAYTSNEPAYVAYPAGSFGQIRISHRFINGTDAQNGRPTTKAIAYPLFRGAPVGADIHFDNGDPWAVVGTSSEPDVLGVMAHEVGHTLGIGHSTLPGTVMYRAALRRSGPATGLLTPDDVAAVQSLYGAGVGSVTPLAAIPEPMAAALVASVTLGWLCRRRVGG